MNIYEKIKDINDIIKSSTYADENPEINLENYFSASTLAFDEKKQYYIKKYKFAGDKDTNMNMFFGKAIHKYVQEMVLPSVFGKGISEYKLKVEINNIFGKNFKKIYVLGHIDYIIFNSEIQIIEIKTGFGHPYTIPDYYLRQLGFYTLAIHKMFPEKKVESYILHLTYEGSYFEKVDYQKALKYGGAVIQSAIRVGLMLGL